MWIPVGMSSKFSLMTLISRFTTSTVVVYDGALDFALTNYLMMADDYFPITYKVNILDRLFSIASIVWIMVTAALIIVSVIIYVITKSELKDANLLRDNIFVSDRISSPATYGIFRPRIIIPKEYEQADLKYIIAHESAHIHLRDNLWRIIAIITVSLHWFNPLAWLFLKKFLEETELACDERVLSACGEDEKKAYAIALVDCAKSRSLFVSAFGGAMIRLRIDHILSYRRLSAISITCFTVLAITIAYVLLTNASYWRDGYEKNYLYLLWSNASSSYTIWLQQGTLV